MDNVQTENRHLQLLVYGGSGGSGGFVSYCKGLFGSGWVPLNVDTCFVCSPRLKDELANLDANVNVVQHSWIGNSSVIKRLIWHLWLYPRLIWKGKFDVEFYPSGMLPLFRRIFPGKAVLTTTCHNLLPFDLKQIEEYRSCTDYKGLPKILKLLKFFFKRAAGVIFLSEYSQKMVFGQLKITPKSVIIPHGLEDDFRMKRPRSYVINKSCSLLYVSPILPYKHHDNIIRAVKYIRDIGGYNVHLRLVGGGSNSSLEQLESMIKMEQLEPYVKVIGKLGRLDLQNELANADIYLFASTIETFGITLLEGMGFRLPIASSNQTGLDAILRDAGVYFDPEDYISISEAIMKLLNSETLRQTCGETAFQYSLDFSWQKCSTLTFSFLWSLKKGIAII